MCTFDTGYVILYYMLVTLVFAVAVVACMWVYGPIGNRSTSLLTEQMKWILDSRLCPVHSIVREIHVYP